MEKTKISLEALKWSLVFINRSSNVSKQYLERFFEFHWDPQTCYLAKENLANKRLLPFKTKLDLKIVPSLYGELYPPFLQDWARFEWGPWKLMVIPKNGSYVRVPTSTRYGEVHTHWSFQLLRFQSGFLSWSRFISNGIVTEEISSALALLIFGWFGCQI